MREIIVFIKCMHLFDLVSIAFHDMLVKPVNSNGFRSKVLILNCNRDWDTCDVLRSRKTYSVV